MIYLFILERNKAQTYKVVIKIKKSKSGNNISKQMNMWAPLSNWSRDVFRNESSINVLNSPKNNLDLNFALNWNCHSSTKILRWFIIAWTALSGFQLMLLFSIKMPLFGVFFSFFFIFFLFSLFHYALKNLKFVQNEWKVLKDNFRRMGISPWFLFPQENSLAQVSIFDPNRLLKYVM